jgi:hypothetical protein
MFVLFHHLTRLATKESQKEVAELVRPSHRHPNNTSELVRPGLDPGRTGAQTGLDPGRAGAQTWSPDSAPASIQVASTSISDHQTWSAPGLEQGPPRPRSRSLSGERQRSWQA